MYTSPLSNKPKISQQDINSGFVNRYFVRNISLKNVTEVDVKQYEVFRKNPMYQTIKLPWIIMGNANDTVGIDGKLIYGTRHKNSITVAFYERQLPGLSRVLRNPLEYFYGVMNSVITPRQEIGIQEIYEVTAPEIQPQPITPPGPSGAVILTLQSSGKVAAYSNSPVAGSVDAWTTTSLVTSSLNGSISLVSNEYRISHVSSGDTFAYPSGSERLTSGYIQIVISGATSTAVTAATGGVKIRVSGSRIQRRVQSFASTYGGAGGQTQGIQQYNDSNVILTQSVATLGSTLPTTLQLAIDNNFAQSWESNGRARTLPLSGSSFSGFWGIHAEGPNNSNVTFREMYLMKSRYITVQYDGPESWYATVTGDNNRILFTSTTASAGTASIDTFSTSIRYPSLQGVEIRRTNDSELLYYNYPTSRVWGGDIFTVAFVSGSEPPAPSPAQFTVTSSERTQLGRILAMQGTPIAGVTTAFNTSSFVTPAPMTASLSSGNLVLTIPSGSFTLSTRVIVSGSFDNMFVQSRNSARTGQLGFGPVVNLSADGSASYAMLSIPGGFTGTLSSLEVVSGSTRQTVSHTPTLNVNLPLRGNAVLSGSVIKTFTTASNANIAQTLPTASILTAGFPGMRLSKNNASSASVTITDYVVMRNDKIRVQASSPVSYIVHARNASNVLLGETFATNGVAEIDTYTSRINFPDVTKLEIRSTAGTLLHTIEPTERIWAGDIWTLNVTQST